MFKVCEQHKHQSQKASICSQHTYITKLTKNKTMG
jgi:hypothetical protein